MPTFLRRCQIDAALLVIGLAASTSCAELIENGGFETGNFSGWFVPPNIPMQSRFTVNSDMPHSGEHYAQLSSSTLQFVSQILPTEAGSDYELSFWLRRPINAPALFRVRWEGEAVFSQFVVLPNATDWHHFALPLHASFTGSFLEFGQQIFPGEFHIDDISVVQVPAPSAAALIGVAGACALGRRRRRGR